MAHTTRTDAGLLIGRSIVVLAALVASLLVWGAPATADPGPASAPDAPPVSVGSTADQDDGVSLIHAFGEHTCGVQDDRVYCWGHASERRLGQYGFKENFRRRPSPRFGYGLTEADYMLATTGSTFDNTGTKGVIAMGGLYTTCVIQGDSPAAETGTLYCWGFNVTGQVGAGSVTPWASGAGIAIPTEVVDGGGFVNTNVIDVDGGAAFTCAIEGATADATEGVLYCWGGASAGQLGAVTPDLAPVKVADGGGFVNSAITDISMGFDHSCLLKGGSVYCWGGNGNTLSGDVFPPSLQAGSQLIRTGGGGRAGQPSTTTAIAVPTAVVAGGGFTNTGVDAVSAGYRHSCAIEAGSVYCWGNNASGQLGNGTTTSSDTPVKVVAGGGFTNTAVTRVVAGDHHTCAVEAGSVYCWGEAQLGRLGDQTDIRLAAASTPVSAPVRVADGAMGNSGVTLADGSGAHMCATKDGRAFCWGPGEKWNTLSDGSMTTTNYFLDGHPRLSDAPAPRLVRWVPPVFDLADAPEPPSAPLNVRAEGRWGAVRVTWDEPVNTNAAWISNFLVAATPGGQICITRRTTLEVDRLHEARTCDFTRLTPGENYTFEVRALNLFGWSESSQPSGAASPKTVRITSFERKRPFLSAIVGTDVRVRGVAPGYPEGTTLTPFIRMEGSGWWTGNPTTVRADGTFTWQRRFGRDDSRKSVRVYFAVQRGGASNEIRVDPSRSLFRTDGSDLGGMPAPSEPTTDIQFGFADGAQFGGELPVQFHGTDLEPASTVTATLTRSAPAGFVPLDLWGEAFTTASNEVDEFGDVFTIVSLPSDLGAGFYEVTFSGTAFDGSAISATNRFAVTDNSSSWLYSQGVDLEPVRRIFGSADDTPRPSVSAPGGITALRPSRLADTRDTMALEAEEVLEVVVAGRGGVPVDATAAMLNVTATRHVGDNGFLTVYPCGSSRPDTSVLNVHDGETVANAATVALDDTGKVCIYTFRPTEVIVDVMGYSADDSEMLLNPVDMSRILDTRHWSSPRPSAGDEIEVTIPAAADGVAAVALNVTMVEADEAGFITVYPCGTTRPNTSNANVPERGTAAGSVLVPVGAGEKVCVYTSAAADIIVDISGEYRTDRGLGVQVHVPVRVVDSRRAQPLRTVEDEEWGTLEEGDASAVGVRLAAGETKMVSVDSGFTGSASAVIANVTVENPSAPGYLTVYDCGDERPATSNLNFGTGENRANQVVIPMSTETVCVYTYSELALIVDVSGRYVEYPT